MASEEVTEDQAKDMEQRARRFEGAWTGTSGSLAADVIRLLKERRRLLDAIALRENLAGHRVP